MGLHWLTYHLESRDWDHIERMQYKSVKVFEWCWRDRDFCNKLLSVCPKDTIFLARDYPLSDQKDWQRDPIGTGIRHADEWKRKKEEGNFHLPIERTYFLGANEPEVWSYRTEAVSYYAAFLNRLKIYNWFGGGLNLSVGWPGTKDGTAVGLPYWEPYEEVHQAIVDGNHLLVLHEYGTAKEHGYGYWMMRLKHCPWKDVQIVIGECGIDQAVAGGEHQGWQHSLTPQQYVDWLDVYHAWASSDSRIHSLMPFTYDFSQPWGSFDMRPAREALERKSWTMTVAPTTVPDKPPVAVGTGPVVSESDNRWAKSIAFVLKEEGGFQNLPEDSGNYHEGRLIGTKYGISAASWAHKYDIPSLTIEQAQEIYYEHYWKASGADKLAWPLCLLVFDTAVLHGTGTAQAWIREVGVNPFDFFARRLRVYTESDKWKVFGLGWTRRVGRLSQALGT
jgi:hypothetical protein